MNLTSFHNRLCSNSGYACLGLYAIKLYFCSHSWSSCCAAGNTACNQAWACEHSSLLTLRTFVSEMQTSLVGILEMFVVHFKLPHWGLFFNHILHIFFCKLWTTLGCT